MRGNIEIFVGYSPVESLPSIQQNDDEEDRYDAYKVCSA